MLIEVLEICERWPEVRSHPGHRPQPPVDIPEPPLSSGPIAPTVRQLSVVKENPLVLESNVF